MYFFWVTQWLKALYRIDLVKIHFYPSMSDHVPQEFASPHTKVIFVGIKMQLLPSEYFKYIREIANMLLLFFGFMGVKIPIQIHLQPWPPSKEKACWRS